MTENQLSSDKSFAGMTLNERLFHAGLLGEFDDALAKGDEQRLRTILQKVRLTPAQIEDTISRLLN